MAVTNGAWDARAQRLFRLRCPRRCEPLVRCGTRIVPDAIEFRDQVDGFSRRWSFLDATVSADGLIGSCRAAGVVLGALVRATCLLMTFSTTLPQALRVSIHAPY